MTRLGSIRAAIGGAALCLVAAVSLFNGPAATADAVPFTDPNAQGYIGLCDASGHQITQGDLSQKPFVVRFVSSSPAPDGYRVGDAGKTTLFAYQPIDGIDPADWSGEAMTGPSFFNDNTHPLGGGTVLDYSMRDFVSTYPPKWDGLVQLRVFYGAPNHPTYLQPYPATVLKIDGNRWHAVSGGPVDCRHGKMKPAEELALPKSKFASASASIARSKSAAAARSAANNPSGGAAPVGQASSRGARPGAGNAGTQSGANATSSGGPSDATPSGGGSGSASPVAATQDDHTDSGTRWLAIVLVVAGVAVAAAVATRLARRRWAQ